MTLEDAIARYGKIENGVWVNESQWCTMVRVPAAIAVHLVNSVTRQPCVHIYCNRDIAPSLEKVFSAIVSNGLEEVLSTYDGCLMVRDVRGSPGALSTHAYALAVDFDAAKNALGVQPQMDPRIVAIFETFGFFWGGKLRRLDGMHFSMGWEP